MARTKTDDLRPEPKVLPKVEAPQAKRMILAEGFAALRALDNEQPVTPQAKKAHAERRLALGKVISELQNGPPPPVMTADAIVRARPKNIENPVLYRLRLRARSDRDIAWIVQQYDSLKK